MVMALPWLEMYVPVCTAAYILVLQMVQEAQMVQYRNMELTADSLLGSLVQPLQYNGVHTFSGCHRFIFADIRKCHRPEPGRNRAIYGSKLDLASFLRSLHKITVDHSNSCGK